MGVLGWLHCGQGIYFRNAAQFPVLLRGILMGNFPPNDIINTFRKKKLNLLIANYHLSPYCLHKLYRHTLEVRMTSPSSAEDKSTDSVPHRTILIGYIQLYNLI